MTGPKTIYTSGDNAVLAALTLKSGWLVGMRSDKYAQVPIDFMDVNYKAPNFDRHLAMCKEHKPRYAVVPDLSDSIVDYEDIRRALRQADMLQPYCETVYIVPKLAPQLALIPNEYAIGYSVPTSNGGSNYNPQRLKGRRVHLLGGSPHFQMKLYRVMKEHTDIPSIDGNMLQRVAFIACKYWEGNLYKGTWKNHPRKHTDKTTKLALECIELSLLNIGAAWQQKTESLEIPLFR